MRTILTAHKANIHCARVWRVAVLPVTPALRMIVGANLPCYGKRWGVRKLRGAGYYHLHLGGVAVSVAYGVRARDEGNGMYHTAALACIVFGLH